MSGDSLPLPLPLSCFAADSCEATTLYQELRKPLLRYLVCLGLSSDDAQDVVQDAFLSLQRRLEATGRQAPPAWAKSDQQENIRGWLFRVAHNRARNRQTSYDRRFAAPLEAASDAIAEQASPERAVLEKEKFRRLREATKRLTASERECLLLRAAGLR